jgi:hypothetical protein
MTSGTWHVATSPLPWMDPAIRQLAEVWRDEQVRLQIYTRDEMDALELPTSDPTRECSWAAPPNQQQGPWSLRAMANGKVIAGLELWMQHRDRFWFPEMLIRDQAPAYAGVGRDVARSALGWVARHLEEANEPYGLRVHAMEREKRAVKFWTNLIGRKPDTRAHYQRAGKFTFPAVGWIIIPTP